MSAESGRQVAGSIMVHRVRDHTSGRDAPETSVRTACIIVPDLFSLGVLRAMRLPRGGCHSAALPPFEIMDQLRRADPASLTSMHRPVPEELNRIVLKCLAKDPAGRYQSAAAVTRIDDVPSRANWKCPLRSVRDGGDGGYGGTGFQKRSNEVNGVNGEVSDADGRSWVERGQPAAMRPAGGRKGDPGFTSDRISRGSLVNPGSPFLPLARTARDLRSTRDQVDISVQSGGRHLRWLRWLRCFVFEIRYAPSFSVSSAVR